MQSAKAVVVCVVLFSMVASSFSGVLASGPQTSDVAGQQTVRYADAVEGSAKELRVPLTFGDIVSEDRFGYELLTMDGATGYRMKANEPMVPMYSHMFPFPVGTAISSVSVEDAVYARTWTDKKVAPAPEAVPMIDGTIIPGLKEGSVYSQSALFPQEEVLSTVTTGQGEWGGVEAHLFVKLFPLRWNPITNVIQKIERCELVIRYVPPDGASSRGPKADQPHIDLLVLHPDEYGAEIARYITHKESMGWTVKNASLSEVYTHKIFNVSKGRDNQERIKYFIKQAFENWTMESVLVVGDSDKFPIRQVWVNDIDGTATPTDLYYEDLFKGGTMTFSDWNSDGDTLWGESSGSNKNADQCDLDPDVAVGRFPVGTVPELRGVINKTISYDTNISKADSYEWFKNVTLVGSDTFTASSHGETSGVPEGEYTMDYDTQWLGGFTVSKFYETKGTLNTNNIKNNVAKGAGIMAFADHGSEGGVVYGYSNGQWGMLSGGASTLNNGHKLPLSIMDACLTHKPDYSESIGEYLVLNPNGGAIGSIGATRIAYGMWSIYHIEANSGFIDTHLFQEHQNGTIMPALMLNKAKRDYQNEVGIWDYADFKTQVQYIYYGDPVVWIGGIGLTVEPVTNPITLGPGETGQFLIGLDNRGLVADDLVINITNGSFSYTLSDYSLHMKADSIDYITVDVTVPAKALAGARENITLNVTPKSTTVPILTNLTTIVKTVRDVKFVVPKTDFTAMPGEHVSVDFTVQNDGNVPETAAVSVSGGEGDFMVEVSSSGLRANPFAKYNGNITFLVPDGALAGNYYFELVISTASGESRSFMISVEVGKSHGLTTYIIDDSMTFMPDHTADFQVYIGNSGNHRERFALTVALVDTPKWGSMIYWDAPAYVTLEPFENVTETVTVKSVEQTLAGDVGLTLEVASTEDGGPSEELSFTATVPRVSGIGITALEDEAHVKEGQSASFELVITSDANFDETVTLTVEGVPADWTMTQDVSNIVVWPFSNAHVELTFTVPAKFKASEIELEVTAVGNSTQDAVGLMVTVDQSDGVAMKLDKTEFIGYEGDRADIKVEVENKGNHEGVFIITVESVTDPFQYSLPTNALTLGAWTTGEVPLSVMIPAGASAKDGTLKLKVRLATDGAISMTGEVKLKSLFRAKHDLETLPVKQSEGYIGQSGSFTIVLVNNGNVEETVSIGDNGTTGVVVQFPANVTILPGETKEVVVSYDVPKETAPGQLPIKLALSSPAGTTGVEHTVTAKKVPIKKTNAGTSLAGGLPYLLIIIVLIIVILVMAIVLAVKGRSKGGQMEPMAPVQPAPASSQPMPEAPPTPEPVKPASPAPAAPVLVKSIGGGPPQTPSPPQTAPQPQKTPVEEDKAIDDVLKDLDK